MATPLAHRPGGDIGNRAATLFYGGDFDGRNGFTNEFGTAVSDSQTYDDFLIDNASWTIESVFANHLIDNVGGGVPLPTSANVEVRGPGVIGGGNNCLADSVVYQALSVPVTTTLLDPGPYFGASELYRVEADIADFSLPTGHYYLNVQPIGVGVGQFFVGTTSGANSAGEPIANDDTWAEYPDFGFPCNDTNDVFGAGTWDVSSGITGTATGGNVPPAIPPNTATCNPAGDLVQSARGLCPNAPSSFSIGPVRYFDGTIQLAATDLSSAGFGTAWGHTRSWTNGPGYAVNSLNGFGMVVTQQASLLQVNGPGDDSVIAVVSNGTTARYFDAIGGGNYTPRFFSLEKLQLVGGEFRLTDTTGDVIRFFDFNGGLPVYERGQFKSFTDPAGNITAVTSHTVDGKSQEVQRSTTVGGTTTTESYLYSYFASGPNAGLLQSVALRRAVNFGAWTVVRHVDYTYYDGVELYGNLGDLRTAIIRDGAGAALDTTYYRYYTPGDLNGYTHGLKFVFNSASYARLAGAVANPLTSTDSVVAPYADNYYEYDAQQRVTREIVQGAGCSACTGGQGTFSFSYTTSAFVDDYNHWKVQTIETLPDGNQTFVFSNFAGEVMLKAFRDNVTGTKWIDFYKYDNAGRVILHASPSAVTGYDSSQSDLLVSQANNYQFMADNLGLVETTAFYASGPAAGYFEQSSLQRGEFGAADRQKYVTYVSRSDGQGVTIQVPDTETVYRNAGATDAQVTSYAYTWFPNTTRMQSRAVSRPVVSAAQNGPGTPDVETTTFDTYGRVVQTEDGGGFVKAISYDEATSAVVQLIVDVGGLNLVTQREVDNLGRETKRADPAGTISYTTYNDPNHERRIYPGWDVSTNRPTGPTEVTREIRPAPGSGYPLFFESLTMAALPAVDGNNRPTGAEAISDLQTLSRTHTNQSGQVIFVDPYFNLSVLTYTTNPTLGTEGVHFHRTRHSYDARGRRNQTITPTGTITRTDYDGLGRPLRVWVNARSPGPGLSERVSVKTEDREYDGGNVGDSNLTKLTEFPGGTAAPRVSEFFYDWRNRRVASKGGVQTSESADTQRPIVYLEYDNLNQIVIQEQYDGDGVTITIGGNGVPDRPAAGLLRSKIVTAYDDRGRVFRTEVFSVDQTNGTVSSNALTSNTFYDRRSNVIKTASPGGLVTKYAYDGVGRPIRVYATDAGGDTTWADAGNVVGDQVVEQVETLYDDNGNAILTTNRLRLHDAAATGDLTAASARNSFVAYYYDPANRTTAMVDVGTNGGAAYTRPPNVPPVSDTVLVTSYAYNDAGWVDTVTDPRNLVTKHTYDALGRAIKTIEAFTDGIPTASTNHITEMTYDGSNHVLTQKAVLPDGAFQTTQYLYNVRRTGGSNLNSNDLLSAVRYPDKGTGLPSDLEKELFTYNALGQMTSKRDRNGTVHTYNYDVLGRPTADAVTTLGAGVDGQIRRIEIAYDTAGRSDRNTSYNAVSGGAVVNQVFQVYNGLGQLVTEYQAHAGAVDTGTTPKVQYAYSEMSGGANHSRLVSMTYPNGRVLNHTYFAGLDDTISRLSRLSDNPVGTLETYSYLGLNTVVKRGHIQPGVDLTYIKQGAEPNGDAGDQYTGLDRFGRVVDQRWLKTAGGTATDRFQYGYDRDGNRLYRDNEAPGGTTFGELYSYDALNRLPSFSRGKLNATHDGFVGSPSHTQDWQLDLEGNWKTLTNDGVPQNRTHNQQNQITSVSGQTTPTYDPNGNMTRDETGKTFASDAWNRLVRVKDTGGNTLASYTYDALDRRITENGGTPKDLYYSSEWQLLEEQIAGVTQAQYVWSPVYVDALILRDRGAERLYVQQDANWNVTAVVNTSGSVLERYAYDPYGKATVYDANWDLRGDGSVPASLYGWVHLHQGGRFDTDSGLYHFRNRDYSPTLGRWLQVDPIGVWGDAGNLGNGYAYLKNNPLNWVDPLGEVMTCWCTSWYDNMAFSHWGPCTGLVSGCYNINLLPLYLVASDPDGGSMLGDPHEFIGGGAVGTPLTGPTWPAEEATDLSTLGGQMPANVKLSAMLGVSGTEAVSQHNYWYYQAWPESTFRQYHLSAGQPASFNGSFADALRAVTEDTCS